jgi:hypothetical protein
MVNKLTASLLVNGIPIEIQNSKIFSLGMEFPNELIPIAEHVPTRNTIYIKFKYQ